MDNEIKQILDKAYNYVESDERNTLIMESHIYSLIDSLLTQQKEIDRLSKGIDASIYHLANEDISDEFVIDQIRMDLVGLLNGDVKTKKECKPIIDIEF